MITRSSLGKDRTVLQTIVLPRFCSSSGVAWGGPQQKKQRQQQQQLGAATEQQQLAVEQLPRGAPAATTTAADKGPYKVHSR